MATNRDKRKSKAIPLRHAGAKGRGEIAPAHSLPRH
jgi:hypothetical protein